MKKIFLMLAIILLAGCHPMDRINETDPLAGAKFKGMTYLGEIGSFSLLSDFIVTVDPVDSSKYYIFAVDSVKFEIDKYSVDGTPVDIYPNPTPPFPQPPTGICAMDGYCYIINPGNTVAFNITNIAAWQDSTVAGSKILSYNGTLYTVISDPPGVAPFVPDVSPPQLYTPGTPWVITKGNSLCANCMSYISDIAVHPSTGDMFLVDSVLKRISIFTTAGANLGNIDIGTDISSAAFWVNTLYVPTTDGIRRYNYDTVAKTLTYIDTIANFGEGNGRVMKPGPIELYQGQPPDNKYYIFVGAGTFIKVFQIAGL